MEEMFERSRAHLAKAAERQKRHYDVRAKIRSFIVGEWVFDYIHQTSIAAN